MSEVAFMAPEVSSRCSSLSYAAANRGTLATAPITQELTHEHFYSDHQQDTSPYMDFRRPTAQCP